jgi:hypothetical protein
VQTQQALEKTRTGFLSKLSRLFTGKRQIDADFLESKFSSTDSFAF